MLTVILTIVVICTSYSQIIEVFPSGGGGYLVASKLLSPTAGVVSGCALIGDYVLTSGCAPAIVLVDAVIRFIPGVIGHPDAVQEDSFQNEGLFDGPHFTGEVDFEGALVPQVLREGNHAKIRQYRLEEAIKKTRRVRPELVEKIEKEKQREPLTNHRGS